MAGDYISIWIAEDLGGGQERPNSYCFSVSKDILARVSTTYNSTGYERLRDSESAC